MDLHKTDAEFMEIAGRFAFDEVVNEPEARLEPATRWLAVLAALTGCQGLELYRKLLPRALDEGLPPVWAKEAAYQAVDYLGLGRALPFVEAASEVFAAHGLELPGCGEAAVTADDRLEKGAAAQAEIFGAQMLEAWKAGLVNRWLAANCFGDYYTRSGLTLAQREMITFCFLMAQGGCEPQLVSHARGNMNVGNDRGFLLRVVYQCLPYIGYPRSLNAVACIEKAAG